MVIVGGSFDLLLEVVCEDDDHLLALLNDKVRAIPGVRAHRDVHLPPALQADLRMGDPMTDSATPRDRRTIDSTELERARAPPPLDALQPARVVRRRQRGRRSSPAARAATSGTRTASATSTGSRACSPCRSATAATSSPRRRPRQAETLEYFPIWTLRAPAGDRARGPARRARARRPEPGLLHDRRLRGGRVGVEARPPVLPALGRGPALQGHRPRDRLPRHHAGRARDHRRPVAARRRSSRSRPGASHVPTRTGTATRSATTRRRSCSRSPTRSRSAILWEGPETVAAVYLEPVQNAGGCFVPPEGYFQRGPRDLRPLRRAARVRRGDLRVRPARRVVRRRALRLPARHDHVRQGPHQRLLAARRGDLPRPPRRAVPRGHGVASCTASRSAATRSAARSALANLDVFETRGHPRPRPRPRGRASASASRGCATSRSSATCAARATSSRSSWSRTRRRRRRSPTSESRGAAPRLPLAPALRAGLDLPRRRPRRPRRPALPAAHRGRRGVRRDRVDAAHGASPRRGSSSAATSTRARG